VTAMYFAHGLQGLQRVQLRCRSSLRPQLLLRQRLDTVTAVSFTSRSEGSNSNSQHRPSSLKLYDSLSQSIQDVSGSAHSTGEDGNTGTAKGLAFYTCGVTPYAPSHLGHARTYVCLDILRRVLEQEHSQTESLSSSPSPPPLFVMNITDVDDKILATADEQSIAPVDLARHWEVEFWKDMDALNCLRPHVVTRVTEYVDSDIVPYIQRLMDLKMAYTIADDGVYFDVKAYEDKMQIMSSRYGKLAPPATATDTLFTTERIDSSSDPSKITKPASQKRDARDFVLWKRQKEGERMYWASPWGNGRPGWHIECSAMIEAVQERFRETHTFQMHAGGVDLKFPHHTNEIAQAEAYHSQDIGAVPGKEWIPHWVHTGHLHIDGLKMSKSLKNFVTIQDMLSESTSESSLSSRADDFRLWCLGLSGSYRGAATYSPERIQQAGAVRQKMVRFLLDGEEWLRKVGDVGSKKWKDEDMQFFESVREASVNSHQALLSDLDGSTYVKDMVKVAELGQTYLLDKSSSSVNGPTEPVQSVLLTLRGMLSLVGFSDATCRAGLDDSSGRQSSSSSSSSSNVVGGERALLDELVRFRAAVRQAAIADLSSKTPNKDKAQHQAGQEIMRLCDDARDNIFPRIGVELLDGKVHSESGDQDMWKFCVPHTPEDPNTGNDRTEETKTSPATIDLRTIPLQDLFKVAPYEGQFSEYDADGMPTLNADGSALSNRLVQKLRKKRDKHAKRLQNS
jgi:cysteinyl-tRNA synthetase